MDWLSQNWTWLLFIGAMVAMHLFGHGGHGGHGARSGKTATEERPHPEADHEGHA